MIYNLLKRIQNLLASKPSGTKEEQEILSLVSQALPAMLNGHDTETLAANELLVRICPDTKRPVLVCHNGNGQCLCLHNGTTEEDAVDVDLLFDNEDTVLSLEDGTELLDDFDLWKERSDLELEKIMDRNYWSSTGGY